MAQAETRVRGIISDHKELSETVSLEGKSYLISRLMANSGEAFKTIQKVSKTRNDLHETTFLYHHLFTAACGCGLQ